MLNVQPLKGLRILVTRASHQSQAFSDRLESLGATVIRMPLISIVPPDSWQPVDAAIDNISQYDWIIFASSNAVSAFFNRAETLGCDLSTSNLKFAAIGPGTASSLRSRSVEPAYQASQYIAESLVQQFPQYPHLSGVKVLWPKTNIGRTQIKDMLIAAQATVDAVICYKTQAPPNIPELAVQLSMLLRSSSLDVITVASAQTAHNLMRLFQEQPAANLPVPQLLAGVHLVAIGPETAKAWHQQLGPTLTIYQPENCTFAGIIEHLKDYWSIKSARTADCEET